MAKLVINSYEEFASHLGEKLGESDWLQIDQERINKFADATLDPQWIHVDVERAKVESPYHSTIAHGYLTLSVLPYLWQQIIEVNNLKMLVNYGMDEMRFGQPVITGSRVRLVATLHDIQNLRGICKTSIKFDIEIEGQRKPALSGIAIFPLLLQAHSPKEKWQQENGLAVYSASSQAVRWEPWQAMPSVPSFEHGLNAVNREAPPYNNAYDAYSAQTRPTGPPQSYEGERNSFMFSLLVLSLLHHQCRWQDYAFRDGAGAPLPASEFR